MGCENLSEVLEHESIIKFGDEIKVVGGDDNLKPLSMVFSNSLDDSETSSDEKMSEFVLEERKKEVTDGSYVIDGNDGGVMGVKNCKRGRTEKVLEGSECVRDLNSKKVKVDKDEDKVTGRLLRSRTMTMIGSVKVDENSLNESVVGFKRQMEAECFDQVLSRPKKKQKRRGRPPKKHVEAGLKKKIEDKHFDQFEIREVNERSQLVGQLNKKQKRRGRPPKIQSESCKQQKKMQRKEQKDKTGNLPTDINKLNSTLLNGDDDEGIHQVQNQESEITGDNKAKAKASNRSNDHTIIEETVKGDSTKRLKNTEDRRKQQQLVRDKIVSMIMKAKWTIEYRPRQQRTYLDAVYVDPKGKTHWSVTKAYFSLQKKIEDGKADDKEVSAFTPIPVEEMNVLFRSVSKVRCDKNTKKNKRGPNISQAEYVISADSPFKKPPNKKGKDLKKRKEVKNISKVKAKKAKIQHETGVIAESAVQRRPNASEKDRQTRKPCLVARSSSKGLVQDNDDCIYNRKRNIVSWVIDSGVIMPGGTLLYGVGGVRNRVLEGQVTADGINCSCCNEVVDLSSFVSHGGGKLEEAFKSVYYESGSSLLMCLLDAWWKEVELTKITYNSVDVMGDDPHDDTCNICGDGGDLICCDGCPSTFHQSCLDIQNIPSGDWHCVYCCCKFCGLAVCDASHPAPDAEMVKCCLCEEKFHPSCFQKGNGLNGNSCSLSFCGRKCQELYERLQTYIGVKFELKDGYSWSLLKCFDLSQDLDYDPMKVECNSRLAVAFSVMDECFVPVIDERSGVNRIHNVVYNCGSNFKRLDYSGFYTAILEKGGEVISVASIRIRDNWLAEMPFIGTRNMYRRQGMCRRLLDAVEGALSSLGVAELVIPAIPELFQTWTKVFGFEPLDELLRQATKNMSLIVFPGTDMLHKPLFKNEFADENPRPVAVSGDKAVERVTVEDGENGLYCKNKSPNAIADEHKSIGLVNYEVAGVKMSYSISKVVPKNSFDLNLQPAATDIDTQLVYEESISSNPQVCNVSG